MEQILIETPQDAYDDIPLGAEAIVMVPDRNTDEDAPAVRFVGSDAWRG